MFTGLSGFSEHIKSLERTISVAAERRFANGKKGNNLLFNFSFIIDGGNIKIVPVDKMKLPKIAAPALLAVPVEIARVRRFWYLRKLRLYKNLL